MALHPYKIAPLWNVMRSYFNTLGSHLQGPGGYVDQGLAEVHHDPKNNCFC